MVVGCAALAGLWRLGDIVLLIVAAVASVGWVRYSPSPAKDQRRSMMVTLAVPPPSHIV